MKYCSIRTRNSESFDVASMIRPRMHVGAVHRQRDGREDRRDRDDDHQLDQREAVLPATARARVEEAGWSWARSFSTLRMLGAAGGRRKRRRPKVRPGERTVKGRCRATVLQSDRGRPVSRVRGSARVVRTVRTRPVAASTTWTSSCPVRQSVNGAHLERAGEPARLAERRERHVIVDRAVAVDADRGGDRRVAGDGRLVAARAAPRPRRRRGGSSRSTSRPRRRRSRRRRSCTG